MISFFHSSSPPPPRPSLRQSLSATRPAPAEARLPHTCDNSDHTPQSTPCPQQQQPQQQPSRAAPRRRPRPPTSASRRAASRFSSRTSEVSLFTSSSMMTNESLICCSVGASDDISCPRLALSVTVVSTTPVFETAPDSGTGTPPGPAAAGARNTPSDVDPVADIAMPGCAGQCQSASTAPSALATGPENDSTLRRVLLPLLHVELRELVLRGEPGGAACAGSCPCRPRPLGGGGSGGLARLSQVSASAP